MKQYFAVIDTNVLVSALITGNIKHFPCEDLICSPREFLDLIESSEQ